MKTTIYEYFNGSKHKYKTYLDDHDKGNIWVLEIDIPEILHPTFSTSLFIQPEDSPLTKFSVFGASSPRIYWTDNNGKRHYRILPVLSRIKLGSAIFI